MNTPIMLKKVYNPYEEDFTFQYGGASYNVPAGKSAEFVDYISLHCAKKLADKNTKSTNPDEKRVLVAAYLENSDPKIIAKRLGINLDVILAKAVEKGKEKARMNNLESQVQDLTKKTEVLMGLLAKKETKKPAEADK